MCKFLAMLPGYHSGPAPAFIIIWCLSLLCDYAQAPTSGAVVVSGGNAVVTRANSGPVTGLANVGIRRAEIKQGKERGIKKGRGGERREEREKEGRREREGI